MKVSQIGWITSSRFAAVGLVLFGSVGCSPPSDEPSAGEAAGPESSSRTDVERYPGRRALFGDLHVHTSWSTDAYASGNRVGPRDAYRFARGEAVELPGGFLAQLSAPLDFTAITDHAEGFSSIGICTDPEHPLYDAPVCERLRDRTRTSADYLRDAFARGTKRPPERDPGLCGDDIEACGKASRSTWKRTQEVAEEFNEPGRFTALIGYEFSSLLPQFGMLHRNVIFRGSDVIEHAIASQDVGGQADFFAQLDAACQEPCRVLTIPHNTNYSWGLTFSRTDEDGSPYTEEDLERRARLERVVEITQLKGTSECQIGVGTTDEDCDFGNLFPPCEEDQVGRCARPSNFVRTALLDGLSMENESKPNIFKLGIIGSTDTHSSDPGNFNPQQPARYASARGNAQAVEQLFRSNHPVIGPVRRINTGGLAAVWAESNTREDIFDALRRREAFATSGSRLQIRLFAGDLPENIGQSSDAVDVAYERGVPMGADLPSTSEPRFWAWAMKDPVGPTLDRVQVVKGWLDDGEQKHRVWDVACSACREPDAEGRCAPVRRQNISDTRGRFLRDGSWFRPRQLSLPGTPSFYAASSAA